MVAPKSIQRFKEKIRRLTSCRIPITMSERIARINRFLKGWMSYYKIIQLASVFNTLDGWIRRRLRMCKLRQWQKPRTRKRELMKLGEGLHRASRIASSGKGAWCLSKTPQVNNALSNKYWKEQGLLCLIDVHKKLC